MRIVVTGRDGQVARSLLERGATSPGVEIVAVGRPELDLEHPDRVGAAIAAAAPDLVVSAAAYTAVDQAEDEPGLAHLVNADGAAAVARAAHVAGAPVIHLSTDYVFAGDLESPYSEGMPTAPATAYGRSKLAGEAMVAAENPRHLILRTAWVYSPFGRNFVRTMLTLAAGRERLTVVNDQHGNPTSALDIADAVLAVASAWRREGVQPRGVYHYAGTGDTTWCGFARHVFAVSAACGGPVAEVDAITTDQFPAKARRPKNSRLDSARFAADFGHRAPHWRDSAAEVVRRLVESAA